eukprot:SM000010S04212  [mRNA]  locus=s10:273819:274696:- [translate_table: standard]
MTADLFLVLDKLSFRVWSSKPGCAPAPAGGAWGKPAHEPSGPSSELARVTRQLHVLDARNSHLNQAVEELQADLARKRLTPGDLLMREESMLCSQSQMFDQLARGGSDAGNDMRPRNDADDGGRSNKWGKGSNNGSKRAGGGWPDQPDQGPSGDLDEELRRAILNAKAGKP